METITQVLNKSQILSQAYSTELVRHNPELNAKAVATIQRYGDFNKFCSIFSIVKCNEYITTNKDAMFVGSAPTLTTVAAAYGSNLLFMWIELYLADIAKYNGLYEKTDESQLRSIANEIMIHYPHFKITEFMVFFSMFKACRFRNDRGEDATKMFGEFQGGVIMNCLHLFSRIRAEEIDRIEKENAPKVDYSGAVTYDEFLKMKDKLMNLKK